MSIAVSKPAAATRLVRKAAVLAAAGMAITLAAPPLLAQNYPAKAVRIIIPFGAGGGTDIQGRLLTKKFFESMRQTFVVDNRPGASGNIAIQ